ncbi:MAG: iron-sulfur cluster assembly scaffold protein [Candidatus Roseilinea sp.]|nr:MAG: iron-sulfur cluster assembly scaffold protein [Candidatus Roseilinea sp.]
MKAWDMQDLYREHILDHYEHPRHHGVIEHADISHEESNPLCGDRIRIDVKLGGEGDRAYIADAAFMGDGCIISQAATSMLLEDVVGKPVNEIEQIEPQHVLDLVGVPLTAARVKCALLGLKVLKTGIKLWKLRHP